MKNISRSLIITITWSVLLICNVNCSHDVEPTFTYESTMIFNTLQANLPVEFKRESDNHWSFESGIKNARILISITSPNHQDLPTHDQFVVGNILDYEFVNIDSIHSDDKSGHIYTFRKKAFLKRDLPITGFFYHSVAEIKINTFRIMLQSESNGFNLEPEIMKIVNSIRLVQNTTNLAEGRSNKSDSDQNYKSPTNQGTESGLNGEEDESLEVSQENLIKDGRLGLLKNGDVIPEKGSFRGYEVRAETKIIKPCKDESVETVYIFSKNGSDYFYVTKMDESWKKHKIVKIAKFYVLSKYFRTDKKIGVGSTVDKFIAAYPDYKLVGNCGNLLLIKRNDSWMFFYLNKSDYIGNKGLDHPVIYLENSEIRPGSQITEITYN